MVHARMHTLHGRLLPTPPHYTSATLHVLVPRHLPGVFLLGYVCLSVSLFLGISRCPVPTSLPARAPVFACLLYSSACLALSNCSGTAERSLTAERLNVA